MSWIVETRTIEAPVLSVFETVSDISNFSQVVDNIVDVEFLSDTKSGLGTRFRETRLMNGKKAATELEITEYDPPTRVRLVADSHGTVWDTIYTLTANGSSTELQMAMDARAHKLLPKIINPLIKGVVAKAVAKDMNAVKAYCEKQQASAGTDA